MTRRPTVQPALSEPRTRAPVPATRVTPAMMRTTDLPAPALAPYTEAQLRFATRRLADARKRGAAFGPDFRALAHASRVVGLPDPWPARFPSAVRDEVRHAPAEARSPAQANAFRPEMSGDRAWEPLRGRFVLAAVHGHNIGLFSGPPGWQLPQAPAGHFTPPQVGGVQVHLPPLHVGVVPLQALPQLPQFRLVVTLVHVPPQSISVPGHRQMPFEQISPPPHATQLDPQCVVSVSVSYAQGVPLPQSL